MAGQALSQNILDICESAAALSVPIGGGIGALVKWRRAAERDKRAREEASRIAAQRTLEQERKESAEMRDKLLDEKDKAITRLTAELAEEKAEKAQVALELHKLRTNNE